MNQDAPKNSAKSSMPSCCVQDVEVCTAYAEDTSGIAGTCNWVARPSTPGEITEVVQWAEKFGLSIVPRGAGTGTAGGAVPLSADQVLLSLERFKDIEIDRENQVAVVGAGVRLLDLMLAAEAEGLWYPVDPSSLESCSIGGNVATNAGGPRAFLYGVTSKWVSGLQGVWASGDEFRLGGRMRKNVAGYDLISLLCGSEGTLGIVHTVTVQLLAKKPEFRAAVLFLHEEDCFPAIALARELQQRPSAIEYFDAICTDLYAESMGISLDVPSGENLSAILLEWPVLEGEDLSAGLQEMLASMDGSGLALIHSVCSTDERQQRRLWQARRSMSKLMFRLGPRKINLDIAVPVAHMQPYVRSLSRESAKMGLNLAIFGHAGDGNLHCNVMHDDSDQEQASKMRSFILQTAIEMHGTVSGEHGIGIAKLDWLRRQVEPAEYNLWCNVRSLFDPKGILNPGKLVVSDF
jgi:glycolate oxidase